MGAAIYYLGLACLFTHELDAVRHAEWRLMPGLRSLPDGSAASLFVALHVPLFFAVLALGGHPRRAVRRPARLAVAGFLVVHAGLHFGLSSDPAYAFHGDLSRALIASAGVCGVAYLLVGWRELRGAARGAGHAG